MEKNKNKIKTIVEVRLLQRIRDETLFEQKLNSTGTNSFVRIHLQSDRQPQTDTKREKGREKEREKEIVD